MSLLRRGHELILALTRQSRVRYFQTAPVVLKAVRIQNGFTGLDNCFAWDDKHGFGFDKNGQVIIVTPKTHDTTSQMFSSEIYNKLPELQEITQGNDNIPKLDEKLEDYDSDSDSDDYPDFPAAAGSRY